MIRTATQLKAKVRNLFTAHCWVSFCPSMDSLVSLPTMVFS